MESKCTDIKTMEQLISLVSAGARGCPVENPEFDWNELVKLAAEHQVLSLVGCAILHSPELNCPADIRDAILAHTRSLSSSNSLKQQRMHHLINEMQSKGLQARIMKGYAVAQYYAHPECRCAGDTDLLIDPKQERAVNEFLSEKGFQLLERSASSHHGIAAHPKYGKIETHVSLLNELAEDIWFQEIKVTDILRESPLRFGNPEGSYETLGYTDHLIYVTLHMIKHFIGTGLTMRMLIDIALYYSANKDNIEYQRFWNILERVKCRCVVDSVLWMMIEHGGFRSSDFPGIVEKKYSEVDLILNDLLHGGYMGGLEIGERHVAAMFYNRQMILKDRSSLHYFVYMIWWKFRNGTAYMFPSKELLVRLHPMVKQYPMLAPIFRIYQLVIYPIQRVVKGTLHQEIHTEHSKLTEASKRRLELFKKLGMM